MTDKVGDKPNKSKPNKSMVITLVTDQSMTDDKPNSMNDQSMTDNVGDKPNKSRPNKSMTNSMNDQSMTDNVATLVTSRINRGQINR
jgi:hypothetical protein